MLAPEFWVLIVLSMDMAPAFKELLSFIVRQETIDRATAKLYPSYCTRYNTTTYSFTHSRMDLEV